MPMSKKEKKYANAKAPAIAAVINGLYSFVSENDAALVLAQLKTNYIISNQWPNLDNEMVLWVRGFDINKEDERNGHKGNFGRFKIDKLGKTKFTIKIEKIPVEAAKHPERKYQKQQHPNWGHPVLRLIKRKKLYTSIAEAEKDLRFLQEEFPLVAIPAQDKLYLMVYEKTENKPGIKKYIFKIKNTEEGKFYIDYKINTPQKKPQQAVAPITGNTEKPPQESLGEFTSKVLLKRAMKQKRSPKPAPKLPLTPKS